MTEPHIDALNETIAAQRPGFRAELESTLIDEWRDVAVSATDDGHHGSRPARIVMIVAAALIVGVMAVVAVRATRSSRSIVATPPPVSVSTPVPTSALSPTTVPSPTSAPATTSAPTSTIGSADPCTQVVAPPSLVDGSPTGEPSIVEGTGADPTIATWADGQITAVRQEIGLTPDPAWFTGPQLVTSGPYEAAVIPDGERALGAFAIHLRGADACVLTYVIGPGYQHSDASILVQRWLDFLVNGTETAGGRHDDLVLPVDYFGSRYVDTPPHIAINRFSPVGTDLGAFDDGQIASLINGIALADGRLIRVDPEDGRRCFNRSVYVSDAGPETILHAELAEADSIVVTGNTVVATRDVCPAGTQWGDPGTGWQLVRLDLDRPNDGLTILTEHEPDYRESGGLFDEDIDLQALVASKVDAISGDGRYVALTEPYNIEQSRWQIRDLDSPAAPLELATACSTPPDIAARPWFLPDNRVVVARFCRTGDGTGDVLVEVVNLVDGQLLSSSTLSARLLPSYGNTVDLSVVDADGLWIIVSGSDVETPTTSILVHGDQQLDISHLGFSSLAFSPAELVT